MDKQTQKNLLDIVKRNYNEIAEDFDETRKKQLWPELENYMEKILTDANYWFKCVINQRRDMFPVLTTRWRDLKAKKTALKRFFYLALATICSLRIISSKK